MINVVVFLSIYIIKGDYLERRLDFFRLVRRRRVRFNIFFITLFVSFKIRVPNFLVVVNVKTIILPALREVLPTDLVANPTKSVVDNTT